MPKNTGKQNQIWKMWKRTRFSFCALSAIFCASPRLSLGIEIVRCNLSGSQYLSRTGINAWPLPYLVCYTHSLLITKKSHSFLARVTNHNSSLNRVPPLYRNAWITTTKTTKWEKNYHPIKMLTGLACKGKEEAARWSKRGEMASEVAICWRKHFRNIQS